MTKDQMFLKIIDVVEKNTEGFSGIKDILRDNNDKSVMHCQDTQNIMKENTIIITEIKAIGKSIDRSYKVVSFIMIAIVLALIVLAGAEKVLPLLKIPIL